MEGVGFIGLDTDCLRSHSITRKGSKDQGCQGFPKGLSGVGGPGRGERHPRTDGQETGRKASGCGVLKGCYSPEEGPAGSSCSSISARRPLPANTSSLLKGRMSRRGLSEIPKRGAEFVLPQGPRWSPLLPRTWVPGLRALRPEIKGDRASVQSRDPALTSLTTCGELCT